MGRLIECYHQGHGRILTIYPTFEGRLNPSALGKPWP